MGNIEESLGSGFKKCQAQPAAASAMHIGLGSQDVGSRTVVGLVYRRVPITLHTVGTQVNSYRDAVDFRWFPSWVKSKLSGVS